VVIHLERLQGDFTKMALGTIKRLTDRGFGFITTDSGELFFHMSALEGITYDELREGQSVEYTEGQGPKGPRAETVRAA
jgi:CspA family cold shock protein